MVFCFAVGIVDTDIIAGEKPSEVVEAENFMLKQFQLAEPELKGQIQPEESVRETLRVIDSMDAQSSGQLLSHHGNKSWF